jgi:hypothetical protein
LLPFRDRFELGSQACVRARANFRQPAIEFLRQPSGPQRRGTELGCGKVHASVALPIERTQDVEVRFQPRLTVGAPDRNRTSARDLGSGEREL